MSAFGELVDGCEADVSVHRYATFADLLGYCRCVAGSVGRLSLGVYGRPALPPEATGGGGVRTEDSDDTWAIADSLGVALQLTNILRDVREDRLIGRIYLPAEDLERFGCTLEVDAGGRLADPRSGSPRSVRYEAERAEGWYQRGLSRLLPRLDRRSAACTAGDGRHLPPAARRIAADPDLIRAAAAVAAGRGQARSSRPGADAAARHERPQSRPPRGRGRRRRSPGPPLRWTSPTPAGR